MESHIFEYRMARVNMVKDRKAEVTPGLVGRPATALPIHADI